MGHSTGKSLRLSPFRRLVVDLMRFSQKVPSVAIDRRMDLSAVAEARQKCLPRPSWTAIFTKAYATVARDYPELRQSYMKFPWPRLYEHPYSVATLNIGRELPGERIVLYCLIGRPENRTLSEIDAVIRHHRETPVEQLRSYQRALATSRIPWPIRQMFWSGALNLFGRRRCHNYGTFGTSSVAAQGAGVLQMVPLLTSTLHYGLFDEQGRLDMRLSWDHRVVDGMTMASVLVDLEAVLHRDILAEIHQIPGTKAA